MKRLQLLFGSPLSCLLLWFLARDAFIRTNRRAVAVMFVRLSVCLGRACNVHCDHTVHFSADLSLRLVSAMFWAP